MADGCIFDGAAPPPPKRDRRVFDFPKLACLLRLGHFCQDARNVR